MNRYFEDKDYKPENWTQMDIVTYIKGLAYVSDQHLDQIKELRDSINNIEEKLEEEFTEYRCAIMETEEKVEECRDTQAHLNRVYDTPINELYDMRCAIKNDKGSDDDGINRTKTLILDRIEIMENEIDILRKLIKSNLCI